MQPQQITPQEIPTSVPQAQPLQPDMHDHSDTLSQVIMPTKNPASIVAYYCGIFGLIPIVGIPLAIIAIIFGHKAMALWRVQPSPGAKAHAMTGLILGYFELVVLLAFVILMAIVRSKTQY